MNLTYGIRQVVLLTILGTMLTLSGCADQPSSKDTPSSPTTIIGDLEVYYDLRTIDGGIGTGAEPKRASAIHFYDQYIVLETEGQNGQVIPISLIKIFRWEHSQ